MKVTQLNEDFNIDDVKRIALEFANWLTKNTQYSVISEKGFAVDMFPFETPEEVVNKFIKKRK